jgi:hypothetical protein
MFSASDYVVWLESSFFSAYVFFLGFKLGLIRRFRFLHLYLLCAVCVSLLEVLVLCVFGLKSSTYLHCYAYSELLLAMALYLVIVELYRLNLPRNIWRHSWPIFVAIPALLMSLSVVAARESGINRLFHFSIVLSDDAFLASLALTFLLWVISCTSGSSGGISARMIQAWGMYFLLFVMVYCVRQLSPFYLYYAMTIASLNAAWLPVALGYAMVNGLEFGV